MDENLLKCSEPPSVELRTTALELCIFMKSIYITYTYTFSITVFECRLVFLELTEIKKKLYLYSVVTK